MPRVIKRILGNVFFFFFFFTFLLKFKTRKHHNALFSPAQAQHTSAVQRCLFAYSLAGSGQNNLGIVTDVIRKMIKQPFFFFFSRRSLTHPLSCRLEETLIRSPDFQRKLKFSLRRVAANDVFHARQCRMRVMNLGVCAVVKFRKRQSHSDRQDRQRERVRETDR